MNKRIQNIADIREFLDHKISRRDALLKRMDGERAAGQLYEFFRSESMSFLGAVFFADEARKFIRQRDTQTRQDGTEYSDEQKFQDIQEQVQREVFSRSGSLFSDDGRSSSASVNLAADARKDFYWEFFTSFNHGY